MRLNRLFTRLLLVIAALAVTGCAQRFATSYDTAVAAEVARGWKLADVTVIVPDTLTVSEAHSLIPRADIVWREDPPGDRHPQVARIMRDAALAGASGLGGSRPVRLEIVVTRFHALSFEAETRLRFSGVHNIDFSIRALDAQSGAVLAGPEKIAAALPAVTGPKMAEARARGESQKSQISAHLRAVIAGWLGLGPDPRAKFTRLGV